MIRVGGGISQKGEGCLLKGGASRGRIPMHLCFQLRQKLGEGLDPPRFFRRKGTERWQEPL